MLSYLCKKSSVYEDCSLPDGFLALYLRIRALLCCFYCCCWGFITEYVISVWLTLTFLFNSFLFYLLFVFIAEHVVIEGKLCLNLLLVVIYFCHVAHIDKAIDLLFLIFWPYVSWFGVCIFILFREWNLRLGSWLSSFRWIRLVLGYFFIIFFLLSSSISLLLNSFCSYIVLQKLSFVPF